MEASNQPLSQPGRPYGLAGASTPLIKQRWNDPLGHVREQMAARERHYAEQKAIRDARREEKRICEFNTTRTRIMIMSAFLCASISLGIMLRLGDDLFSSVVYGVMIGVATNLVVAIAFAAFSMDSALSEPYDCEYWDLDDQDDYPDAEYNDFGGLVDVTMSKPIFKEETGRARLLVSMQPQEVIPEVTVIPSDGGHTSPSEDMKSFINALSNDVAAETPDILV